MIPFRTFKPLDRGVYYFCILFEEKQQKLQLLKRQAKLEEQKQELLNSLETTLTPAQQREVLLQQVKTDKMDIETLTKVKKSLEEDLEAKRTRLYELEHELDGKDNARLRKHRELRERGEHMTAFMGSFEEKYAEAKRKLEENKEKVIGALECLSESDFDDFNAMQMDVKQENSLEGWNNKYVLLASQVTRVCNFELLLQRFFFQNFPF